MTISDEEDLKLFVLLFLCFVHFFKAPLFFVFFPLHWLLLLAVVLEILNAKLYTFFGLHPLLGLLALLFAELVSLTLSILGKLLPELSARF